MNITKSKGVYNPFSRILFLFLLYISVPFSFFQDFSQRCNGFL